MDKPFIKKKDDREKTLNIRDWMTEPKPYSSSLVFTVVFEQ